MRNLRRGIRNIIYWLPVIWRDYHWDYSSFLDILRHKLEAIRVSSLNWAWIGHEKATEDIEHALSLLETISDDAYEWDFDPQEGWKKRREAIDTLFGIIKDNFQTWWD